MSGFTVADLKRILTVAAGADDAVELDETVLETPFAELGYDSLAILELAGQVQREFSVPMPDESIDHMVTPRSAVAYVNERLAEVAV